MGTDAAGFWTLQQVGKATRIGRCPLGRSDPQTEAHMSTQTQALLDPQIDDAVRLELLEIDRTPIGEIPEERSGTLVLANEEIAPLAYEYWHQRGCPDGSPE